MAFARSEHPSARVVRIDSRSAAAAPGVVAVITAADLPTRTLGRAVRDMPLLAGGRVRFVGERVAAVVAGTRDQAEAAAALVDVGYELEPAVLDMEQALESDAPAVHVAPWDYPGAAMREADGHNLQSLVEVGSRDAVDAVLDAAEHVVDRQYWTPSVHQGYLEPPATLAAPGHGGGVELWTSNKAPYRLRSMLAEALGLPLGAIVVHPVAIGGDFGGKAAPMDAALCALLALRIGRPVRFLPRASEDLIAGNPRHAARIRVRLGCDAAGRLVGGGVDVLFDGGAYAAFKPRPRADLHGADSVFAGYRLPVAHVRSRVVYTHTVPRGHMRAPGSPQCNFAFESALDELAELAGMEPAEIRRRNLLTSGEPDAWGHTAVEQRGHQTLEAALNGFSPLPAPAGWRSRVGLSFYERPTAVGRTSLRLSPAGSRVRAEVAMPEAGGGVHTVVRSGLARLLGIAPDGIEVVHVPTSELPHDDGVGASRVTTGLSIALEAAAVVFDRSDRSQAVTVRSDPGPQPIVTSSCVQVAQVAVDETTGAYRVLQVLTAADVGDVLNPAAHRLQLEGGAAMGYGFACLEDLRIEEGRVWAAQHGEFRMPSTRDVPVWRTVLVRGGRGVGALNVKPVGELANVGVAAAIANALAAAGARVRALPITAERVLDALAQAGP